MLGELLGGDPSTRELKTRIREKTGGNPFFVEEVVQSLAESGLLQGARGDFRLARPLESVTIPQSVRVLLAARIDRLREQEKALLQTAAVVGKNFSETILRKVAGLDDAALAASLDALERADFVREEALYPEREYAFKHPLTQEVAYGSQLAERRKQTHGVIARAMEEAGAGKLDEQAAMISHHFEEAGEPLEAARWSRRAAERAGINNPAEALRHWRKTVELLEDAPESSETAALGVDARAQSILFGWRVGSTDAETEKLFSEGRTLAKRYHVPRSLCLLLLAYGVRKGNTGYLADYLNVSLEAARLAEEVGDAALRLNVGSMLPYAYFATGRLRKIPEVIERHLVGAPRDLRRGLAFGDLRLALVGLKGLFLAYAGELSEASTVLDEVLREGREVGASDVCCYAHAIYADVRWASGDVAGALSHARQAAEIAEVAGNANLLVWAHSALARSHLMSGDWSGAAEEARGASAISSERRTALERGGLLLALLADAALGAEDHAAARAFAEEAVATAKKQGARFY
ncbi:MAG: ATP-binding protein, partial [Candidatus Binatia bacterium]